jgi:hypothetical protein
VVDEGRLNQFIGQMLGDLGLPRVSPWSVWATPCRELAQDAGVDERYLDYRTTASGNAHNEK